jgi:GDP-L-fucose synthase
MWQNKDYWQKSNDLEKSVSVNHTKLRNSRLNPDLEKIIVLPILDRKKHSGNRLMNHEGEALCADLDKLPIEIINGSASEAEILKILAKCGIKQATSNQQPKKEVKNTHINIGTGKDLTIKELAEKVKQIVNFEGELIWDGLKPDGTYRKLLDVSKLNALGWKERVDLDEGIKNYLES